MLFRSGNLIMQNDTLRHVPAYPFDRFGLDPRATPSDFFDHRTGNGTKGHPASADFWQSVAAICRFDKRKLKTIELHPVDLGFGRPRSQRGRPLLAEQELSHEILDRLAAVCAPFGTRIERIDQHGIIRVC